MTRVLVVDDEATVREVLVESLTNAGYEVVEASDGDTALQIAATEPLDIILLDVQMPEMDGFEVLRRLRGCPDTKNSPVILLTSVPPSEGEKAGMDLGVTHYIQKPWGPGVVEATIRVALREAATFPPPITTGQRLLDDS